MLYEMLTGETPFSGSNPLAVMNERLLHDPRPARKLRLPAGRKMLLYAGLALLPVVLFVVMLMLAQR
jgi:hypothetical protein